MRMIRCAALILAVLLGIFLIAGCNKPAHPAADNTEFIIGVTCPLTGSAELFGVSVRNAAQMAVEEINANGGLNGIKFSLVALDDMNDATKVPTNYSVMYEGGMQISLGAATTQPGLEFTELSFEDNVFFITPSASADAIAKNRNGYQMCFADGKQGKFSAAYVNENYKGQTIGVFYKSSQAYSKGIYDQFIANLDPDVTVISAPFTNANTVDFSSQIEILKDCKFIFMPIYHAQAAAFMEQAKDIIAPDAVYYGCDAVDGVDSVPGFDISAIPQEVTILSHFNADEDGTAREFADKYTARYGAESLNQFGASAYDCVYAIYGAMKKAVDDGAVIPANISASDLCDILVAQFRGGYIMENGVTGKMITWDNDGYVSKDPTKYVIKEASQIEN